MKPLCLALALGCALSAHADPLMAPSTLPGSTPPVSTSVPPAAAQPAWQKPVKRPTAITPASITPASPSSEAAPQASPPAASAEHLRDAAVSKQRMRVQEKQHDKQPAKTLTVLEEPIQAQIAKDFATPDLARHNQNLKARFSSLQLDEWDRTELKIDTPAFQQIQPGTPSMRHALPRQQQHTMGLPGTASADTAITAQSVGYATLATNPEQWCATFQQNQPRISRVLIDAEQLTPGMAFVLKGVCLGDAPGRVEVRFPGDNARTVQARVLDWSRNKVFVELPDITGEPPTTVEIVAITADRRMTAGRPFAFMPRWQLVDVPFQYSRVASCASDNAPPFVRARCISGKNDLPSFGYRQPSGLFGNLFSPPANTLWVYRYTEEDIERSAWIGGEDHWVFDLPPYAHLHSWRMSYERLADSQYTQVRTLWEASQNRIVAAWRMGDQGDEGFLRYRIINVKAWLPVGMRLD